jgi:shikimate dehydrogenase
MNETKIPLAGVIGSPIAHSKSPQLHGHWLKVHHLPGYYIPMDVSADNLENVIRTLPEMGFVGVNITVPHKERVMRMADQVTDRATLIGAANTLIFLKDGKIHADNTDGYGFIQNLKQNAPQWDAKAGPAAVFGAGGAARAVIVSLLDAGAPEVMVANRTRMRAEALRADFGKRVKVVDWVQAGNMLEVAATVVNTTSLGMVGKPPFRVPFEALQKGTLVTDLVYAPLKTPLLQEAEEMGCITVDGLGMLLHQAVPAFERWFGVRPEVDDATRAAVLE